MWALSGGGSTLVGELYTSRWHVVVAVPCYTQIPWSTNPTRFPFWSEAADVDEQFTVGPIVPLVDILTSRSTSDLQTLHLS